MTLTPGSYDHGVYREPHAVQAGELIPKTRDEIGVSPTKVRKVPQDSCQLPERKGFSAIPELPRRDLV